MDDGETTPKPSLPKLQSSIKKRKTVESKMKLTQISEKPFDPTSTTELQVVFDSPMNSGSSRQKRAMLDDFYDNAKGSSSIVERAEEIRANLDPTTPSFSKCMVRSNVNQGFWMHLPMRFCKLHMPKEDAVFILENEHGEEHKANYIAQRTALSGGWKAFCDATKLIEGDVLVFQLVEPSKFKVHIVRANGFLNAEAIPLNSVPYGDELEVTIKDHSEKDIKKRKKGKRLKSLSPGLMQGNIQNNSLVVLHTTNGHVVDQFETGSEDLGSNTLEGLGSSETSGDFNEVKSIKNFTIIVSGLAIDSELSDDHRTKYYELCCSQNTYLHDRLLKSINCKLAAEIITQTVNIAEAIRACNLSTSQADYEIWDQTLKGFELLGMNVAFLRARLNRLISLTSESEESEESKRLRQIRQDQARAVEETRALEQKLLTLKEMMGKLDSEVESLKVKAEKHELKFQKEVNAPW